MRITQLIKIIPKILTLMIVIKIGVLFIFFCFCIFYSFSALHMFYIYSKKAKNGGGKKSTFFLKMSQAAIEESGK